MNVVEVVSEKSNFSLIQARKEHINARTTSVIRILKIISYLDLNLSNLPKIREMSFDDDLNVVLLMHLPKFLIRDHHPLSLSPK